MTISDHKENLGMCDCSEVRGRARDYCIGRGHDGRSDPPADKVAAWRERFCRHALQSLEASQDWDISQPARGLGDVIAKVTHATGLDRAVKAVTGGGCGCKKRQEALNAAVPFAKSE